MSEKVQKWRDLRQEKPCRNIGRNIENIPFRDVFFVRCAPSGARFYRVKVPNPPGSGKDIAEGKGVHREMESEGSWM